MKAKTTNIEDKLTEVIIRPNCNIKSRQWWTLQLLKLKNLLIKHLNLNQKKILKESRLTILITKNKEIQYLNQRFRNINKSTDVLSFHLKKKEQINKKYLGDIVISVQYSAKEAKKKKLPIEVELQTLLIHGYLHLLEYDHSTIKESKTMFSLQNKLLKELNFY